jgi:uncharacterized membrane protein YedE/YeeE
MTNTTCRRCRMMSWVTAMIAGLIFGIGLALSGMTQPTRVIEFLDPLGTWDPSLAFVMAGAVGVYAIAYRWIMRHRRDPWFDVRFHLPTRRDLDLQLVVGAALFGVGWGLVGLCPGPAIVAAASGEASSVLFVVAMLAGMVAQFGRRNR